MKKIIYIIFLFLVSAKLYSQGGSNYSILGVGDIIYGHTGSAQAMGGVQVAVPSNNTINMFNPSLWGKIKTTRIQTGYRFNQNVIDNSQKTLLQNNGAMNGFYSVFNFDTTKEISAGLMFSPFSSVNYYMSAPINPNDSATLGLNGNVLYRGSGGLSNITLGVGSKVIDGLYIGASVSAIIGRVEHCFLTNITNTHTTNYQINNTNIVSGFSSNVGIYFEPIKNLGIGAFYNITPKANIEEKNEYLYDPIIQLTRDTVITSKIKSELPSFYGAGLSYKTDAVLFAADYIIGNFKDINIFNPQNNFHNLNRISFGTILLGNTNPYSSLIARTSYKFGVYSEQLYYNVNGQKIRENGITTGFQFPISRTAQIDFSLVFGQRGSLDNGLIKEYFGRMIIDVSIGDRWFNPVKREY
ncbi:MAG: outer membrane protein transport protein [Bacteroidetes bacterium]|nr:outer membrane protein transport protein [Bacteroidota bacterium]